MLGLSGSKTNSSESPADTSRLQSSGDVIDGGGSAVLQGGSTVQSAADGSVQNVLSESSQSVAADANLRQVDLFSVVNKCKKEQLQKTLGAEF